MLPGVFDLVMFVDGRMLRNNLSNTFRRGGRLAVNTPTDSSVALQIVRSMPSQVGSLVFLSVLSLIVLKIEHTVPLRRWSARSHIPLKQAGIVFNAANWGTYIRPSMKTILRPHCVRLASWMVDRYRIGATTYTTSVMMLLTPCAYVKTV